MKKNLPFWEKTNTLELKLQGDRYRPREKVQILVDSVPLIDLLHPKDPRICVYPDPDTLLQTLSQGGGPLMLGLEGADLVVGELENAVVWEVWKNAAEYPLHFRFSADSYRRQLRHWRMQCIPGGCCTQPIFVERRILEDQLKEMSRNTHLLFCLIWGREHPAYDRWCMLASIKLAFVSSLVYFADGPQKLPLQAYVRLFEDYMQDVEEAEWRMFELGAEEKGAESVLRMYNQVMLRCLPLLTDAQNVYVPAEFRYVIDSVVTGQAPGQLPVGKDVDLAYGNFYC